MVPGVARYEVLLVLSSLVTPLYLLPPRTRPDERWHVDVVQHLVQSRWNLEGLSKFAKVEPGSPHRNFVPSFALSLLAYPLDRVYPNFDLLTKFRLLVSLLSALATLFLARRVRTTYGRIVSNYFLLFSASQFILRSQLAAVHATALAFPFVQIALALIVAPRIPRDGDGRSWDPLLALGLLSLATTTLCPSLIALLVPVALDMWGKQQVNGELIVAMIASVGAGGDALLGLLHPHTYLQQNAIDTVKMVLHSFETSLTSANPARFAVPLHRSSILLLGAALPLAFFSIVIDRRSRRIGLPALLALVILALLDVKDPEVVGVVVSGALTICAAASVRVLGIWFGTRSRYKVYSILILLGLNSGFAIVFRKVGGWESDQDSKRPMKRI